MGVDGAPGVSAELHRIVAAARQDLRNQRRYLGPEHRTPPLPPLGVGGRMVGTSFVPTSPLWALGGVLTGRWGRRNYLFFTIVHEVAFPLCCILHGFTSPKSRASFMCLYTPSFDFPQSKWDGVISVIASVLSSSSCQATFFPPKKNKVPVVIFASDPTR